MKSNSPPARGSRWDEPRRPRSRPRLEPLLELSSAAVTAAARAGDERDPALNGAVPEVDAMTGAGRTARSAEMRVALVNAPAGAPLVAFEADSSVAAEQYRIARTAILHHPLNPQVVVVTSAEQGDGKSVSVANLAAALALGSEKDVLVVDADFRRSSLARLWGVEARFGLADVLSGRCGLPEALLRLEPVEKLCFLPARGLSLEPGNNAAELLESPRWAEAIAELRRRFGFVLVDAPPIGAVADYDLIQAQADGVVLVVRPDHTRRSSCWRALRGVARDKLLGVLMNSVEEWFLVNNFGYYAEQPHDRATAGAARPERP